MQLIDAKDIADLKAKILASGLSVSELVATAWASASTFRGSDKRGGANGARIRLAPQKDWEANQPAQLAKVLKALEGVQKAFNAAPAGGKKVSLADLIVLGGSAAIEQAAKAAGHSVQVPFTPGRADATQEQTDVESFAVLEPAADGFRNYQKTAYHRISRGTDGGPGAVADTDSARNDRARRRPARSRCQHRQVATWRFHQAVPARSPTTSSSTLLDMGTEWKATSDAKDIFEGRDRKTGAVKWTGTRADLVFGSNSQLRALAEVYAQDDAKRSS